MPRGTPDLPKDHPDRRRIWNTWVRDPSLTRDESFCEATGEVGDVYLLHPFMLHSASRNLRRDVRIITNPPVSLKEPFCYDGRAPSLVEQKTLRDLGRPGGMPEWKITAARERLVPDRIRVSFPMCQLVARILTAWQIQEEMKRKEMENLKTKGVALTTLEGARELSDEYPS